MIKFVVVVLFISNDTTVSSDTQIKLTEQRLIQQHWELAFLFLLIFILF